jgi:hypothetical protein
MGEGAPWASLLLGLGRVAGVSGPLADASLTLAIDDAGGLKLTLRMANRPSGLLGAPTRVSLSADIELSAAEAARVGRGLCRLVDELGDADPEQLLASDRPISLDDVRWFRRAMTESGAAHLVALVALIRSLMRPERADAA